MKGIIKTLLYIPVIMVTSMVMLLYHILRFFFYEPFANWFENIKKEPSESKWKVVLRGIGIMCALVIVFILADKAGCTQGTIDPEEEYYYQRRFEPGW